MNTSATTGILVRLRAETRVEHEAIERALDLTSHALTLAAYRRRLEQLHGFHRPVEARLPALPGLRLDERRKTPLLVADLTALGVEEPRGLPSCEDLPPLRTAAQRFGCLYVLEGSTLGGQVLGRHVWRTLGVTPAHGARFFHGYGPRTGPMWQAFRAALTEFACTCDASDEDAIVAAAIATFRTLRTWCQAQEAEGKPGASSTDPRGAG